MPSFDVVSKINGHEITNAIDQASRETNTRFDFKGSNARYELTDKTINLIAPNAFQLKQMQEILQNKWTKRELDLRSLDFKDIEESLHEAKQQIVIKEGIDKDVARKIVQLIKQSKLKVQAAIQADQVRVTAKSRDELQQTIAMLKKSDVELPLQFENFRE